MPTEPNPEDWTHSLTTNDQEKLLAKDAKARKKRQREGRRIAERMKRVIDSEDLVNPLGAVRLSGDGMRSFLAVSKLYRGESPSRTLDRVLRRVWVNKVATTVVFPVQIYKEMERVAAERGFQDAEELIEESMIAAFRDAAGIGKGAL